MRRASPLPVVAAWLLLTACGHSPHASTGGLTQTPPPTAAPGAAAVHSTLIRHNYVRLPVPSADLNKLLRIRGDTIVALVDRGAFAGQVYPVISTDDGGDWVIDGPRFTDGELPRLTVTDDATTVAWSSHEVWTRAWAAHRWRATEFSRITRLWSRGSQLFLRADSTEYVSINRGVSWHPLPNAPR
jgi:hypothetical protein